MKLSESLKNRKKPYCGEADFWFRSLKNVWRPNYELCARKLWNVYIHVLRRLVATSITPQIMVLGMLRSFSKIEPQIAPIWAWLSRGHRWTPGVRNPLKSLVTGPSFLVNCYLEIKFHKIIRVNPTPPPPLISIDWNEPGQNQCS